MKIQFSNQVTGATTTSSVQVCSLRFWAIFKNPSSTNSDIKYPFVRRFLRLKRAILVTCHVHKAKFNHTNIHPSQCMSKYVNLRIAHQEGPLVYSIVCLLPFIPLGPLLHLVTLYFSRGTDGHTHANFVCEEPSLCFGIIQNNFVIWSIAKC